MSVSFRDSVTKHFKVLAIGNATALRKQTNPNLEISN